MERLLATGPDGGQLVYLKASEDGALMVQFPDSGRDCELLITRYTCISPWYMVAEGSVVRQTQVLDVSGPTAVVASVIWENESTGRTVAAPPSITANLEPIKQGDAITQAQLQASGIATALNQVAMLGYLADLADGNDRYAAYKLVQTEDLGVGTKYILKSDGVQWLMVKKIYTDTASAMSYAGPTNNTDVALAQAWAQRVSLTYGSIGDA